MFWSQIEWFLYKAHKLLLFFSNAPRNIAFLWLFIERYALSRRCSSLHGLINLEFSQLILINAWNALNLKSYCVSFLINAIKYQWFSIDSSIPWSQRVNSNFSIIIFLVLKMFWLCMLLSLVKHIIAVLKRRKNVMAIGQLLNTSRTKKHLASIGIVDTAFME